MSTELPTSTRALGLIFAKSPPTADPASYHEARLVERSIAPLKNGEILVQIHAASFNHRELWQRKGLYPGTADNTIYGGDGAGVVIGSADANDALVGKRVFLTPTRGWKSDPIGPEKRFETVGGGVSPPIGTLSEYVVVERDEVVEMPEHMSFVEAAAWPICGVTAWRAITEKAHIKKGQNVFIVGIGGGVALTALQICVALGVNVYVSSSDENKIKKAVELGAKGGVNYRNEKWPVELGALIKANTPEQPLLDAIIDQAGGDIMIKTARIMKDGGIVAVYGMHANPQINFTMLQVLKNVELKGITLGSQRELEEGTAFIAKHKISPIISHVIDGLDNADEGFQLLASGDHFGKIVVKFNVSKQGTPPSRM